MVEYLTQAIVLNSRPQKENDRTVDIYTKNFGRLRVRVIGGRRILSKLAPHLDVFNIVTVRLVEKNQITVTDVLTDERFGKDRQNSRFYPSAFKIFSMVRALTPLAAPDLRLWHYLVKSLRDADGDVAALLKIFGYDPIHASCDSCGNHPVKFFRAKDQSFFCKNCGLKARADELTYF
jgi:DNA repair protein RecO